ncbi:hypothetical protein M2266_000046 [Streptomyces sp. SPB162]|nr:hypothetical protein [Streptomyces sp. SPB162]
MSPPELGCRTYGVLYWALGTPAMSRKPLISIVLAVGSGMAASSSSVISTSVPSDVS